MDNVLRGLDNVPSALIKDCPSVLLNIAQGLVHHRIFAFLNVEFEFDPYLKIATAVIVRFCPVTSSRDMMEKPSAAEPWKPDAFTFLLASLGHKSLDGSYHCGGLAYHIEPFKAQRVVMIGYPSHDLAGNP